MKIFKGFDEKEFMKIAKASNNPQIVKDVSYMRVIRHAKIRIAAERLESSAFFIGYHNSDHFRLVGKNMQVRTAMKKSEQEQPQE